MSMSKVAIAGMTRAVATGISLVGVVPGSRRGWRVDQDRRSGEAQQLREQLVASQPSGEVVWLDHQRSRRGSGKEREEGIRGVRKHARFRVIYSLLIIKEVPRQRKSRHNWKTVTND